MDWIKKVVGAFVAWVYSIFHKAADPTTEAGLKTAILLGVDIAIRSDEKAGPAIVAATSVAVAAIDTDPLGTTTSSIIDTLTASISGLTPAEKQLLETLIGTTATPLVEKFLSANQITETKEIVAIVRKVLVWANNAAGGSLVQATA